MTIGDLGNSEAASAKVRFFAMIFTLLTVIFIMMTAVVQLHNQCQRATIQTFELWWRQEELLLLPWARLAMFC